MALRFRQPVGTIDGAVKAIDDTGRVTNCERADDDLGVECINRPEHTREDSPCGIHGISGEVRLVGAERQEVNVT